MRSNRQAAADQAAAYGDVGGLCATLSPDGTVRFGVEALTHDQIQLCLRTMAEHYRQLRAGDDARRGPEDA